MLQYLKSMNERDYMLFYIGISAGLRISDMLQLRKEDVQYAHIDIMEKKTIKPKRFTFPPYIRKDVQRYIQSLSVGEYLF